MPRPTTRRGRGADLASSLLIVLALSAILASDPLAEASALPSSSSSPTSSSTPSDRRLHRALAFEARRRRHPSETPSARSASTANFPPPVAECVRGGSADAVVAADDDAPPAKSSKSAFPVTKSELPHFASMSAMMFLFIYVFTTVRDAKDSLLVSTLGAESIPLLKLCGVLPAASLFIVAYGWAFSVLGRDALFYLTLVPFFIFYAVFAFVLYPNRGNIHFNLGGGGGGGAMDSARGLVGNWSYALFYIVSELWASAGIPLLFWQCANDVTPLEQARRFYPLFAVFGNLAPILSGKLMTWAVSIHPGDDNGFGGVLKFLAVFKGIACLGIIGLHRYVYTAADRRAKQQQVQKIKDEIRNAKKGDWVEVKLEFGGKKNKPAATKKATLSESVRELSGSKYLRAMAATVVCYNLCVELTEVLWKALLRKSYPNKGLYMDFMAKFSQVVGAIALVMQLLASTIIRTLGWKWAAMLTPLSMFVFAIPFFVSVAADEDKISLAMALFIGTSQNVVNKVSKYSLFDPTKEMAYIPLGPNAKVKGKAAVEVLGARLGRGLGSLSQQLLIALMGGGSVMGCAVPIGVLYALAVGVWTRSVSVLAGAFEGRAVAPNSKNGLGRSGKN